MKVIIKTFFNHLVHDVLHDKVELMRSTPNTKYRTIIMHRILKSCHNANNMFGHISSSIRPQIKKANPPIRTKNYRKIRNHFEHDFTCMPLEHWQHASMQVGDGAMLFHVHMDTLVKIRCVLVGIGIQCQRESPQTSKICCTLTTQTT
jgi:hypothetical protein